MSKHTISLAFSVWHHYLKQLAEKHHLSLPNFPIQAVDISHFLPKAEEIVLGKQPDTQEPPEKLASLFESINRQVEKPEYFYEFKPLSPETIFPKFLKEEEKTPALSELLAEFVKVVNDIPHSHRDNTALWLDHFDTAMQCFTCNLPSPYSNEISFYDFTKAVAAFAVALADKKVGKRSW